MGYSIHLQNVVIFQTYMNALLAEAVWLHLTLLTQMKIKRIKEKSVLLKVVSTANEVLMLIRLGCHWRNNVCIGSNNIFLNWAAGAQGYSPGWWPLASHLRTASEGGSSELRPDAREFRSGGAEETIPARLLPIALHFNTFYSTQHVSSRLKQRATAARGGQGG